MEPATRHLIALHVLQDFKISPHEHPMKRWELTKRQEQAEREAEQAKQTERMENQ